MAEINRNSRSILNFRPNISFIEPKFKGLPPQEKPKPISLADSENEWRQLDSMASAINILADGVQAKTDARCDGFYIALDPIRDAAVVAALERKYGQIDQTKKTDLTKITFKQYRECRTALSEIGDSTARSLITPDSVLAKMRADPLGINLAIDNAEAKAGLLRPDLSKVGNPIEPIDIKSFEEKLVNILWKKYFKGTFEVLPVIGSLIPDKIA
jgi:hypothetical protein